MQCKFDRNEFGQFLGSATIVFEKAEDAKQAIEDYNQALLDNRVLTVEYDMASLVRVPKVVKRTSDEKIGGEVTRGGKTLRVGGMRGGPRRR